MGARTRWQYSPQLDPIYCSVNVAASLCFHDEKVHQNLECYRKTKQATTQTCMEYMIQGDHRSSGAYMLMSFTINIIINPKALWHMHACDYSIIYTTQVIRFLRCMFLYVESSNLLENFNFLLHFPRFAFDSSNHLSILI